jgi:hypothetical protein
LAGSCTGGGKSIDDPEQVDAACLWRTFAAELGSYGIQLVVESAGSPDTLDVQETLKLHAGATGKSFEEVLAEIGDKED